MAYGYELALGVPLVDLEVDGDLLLGDTSCRQSASRRSTLPFDLFLGDRFTDAPFFGDRLGDDLDALDVDILNGLDVNVLDDINIDVFDGFDVDDIDSLGHEQSYRFRLTICSERVVVAKHRSVPGPSLSIL